MRIRKRTPASWAASPPPPTPSPPPPLPPLQQPTEKPRGEDKEADKEEEEKRAILVAGEDDDLVRPAPAAAVVSGNRNSATDDVRKPEPQEQDAAAAAFVRCSRNDGKRWRCKKAAVPGYLFCDRHIAWSTRKRKPRASKLKTKSHGSGILDPTTTTVHNEFAEDHREAQRDAGF